MELGQNISQAKRFGGKGSQSREKFSARSDAPTIILGRDDIRIVNNPGSKKKFVIQKSSNNEIVITINREPREDHSVSKDSLDDAPVKKKISLVEEENSVSSSNSNLESEQGSSIGIQHLDSIPKNPAPILSPPKSMRNQFIDFGNSRKDQKTQFAH
jgi:hypothetical protein